MRDAYRKIVSREKSLVDKGFGYLSIDCFRCARDDLAAVENNSEY